MKGGNRRFSRTGVHHVYQRALDRGVIFYTVIDRLVYLSILSVKARVYRIRVLAVAIMFSHIHQSCAAETKVQLCKYIQDSSSIFARMYNRHYGLSGSLFARPFGSSLKRSIKEIRSNLAYVNNNHSENCDDVENQQLIRNPHIIHPRHKTIPPLNLQRKIFSNLGSLIERCTYGEKKKKFIVY